MTQYTRIYIRCLLLSGLLSIQSFAGGDWWYAGHKIVEVSTFYQTEDSLLKSKIGLPDTTDIWNEPSNEVRFKIWKYKNKKYGKK